MGALTPMVFKEGFLTSPFTEYYGCPGTHTLKEKLSCTVRCGCTDTYVFEKKKKSVCFHFQVQYVTFEICVTCIMFGGVIIMDLV